MPFFITSPISTRNAIALIMSRWVPDSLSARKPPMNESGAEIMIVNGCTSELKSEASTM